MVIDMNPLYCYLAKLSTKDSPRSKESCHTTSEGDLMRTFLVTLACIGTTLGCATTTPPAPPETPPPATPAENGVMVRSVVSASIASQCKEGTSQEEYGCSAGEQCPELLDDVRAQRGFHIISVEYNVIATPGAQNYSEQYDATTTDLKAHPYLPKSLHVADTCQHYRCGVSQECLVAKRPLQTCIHPYGCTLLHKLR